MAVLSRQPITRRQAPKRSLVLSGGGMRVSYQSGVLKALAEEGLRFFHGDGTSGGGMTLAMLLSGLTPDEMCERWRTLRVKDFVTFMPFANYLDVERHHGARQRRRDRRARCSRTLASTSRRSTRAAGMLRNLQRVQLHAQGQRSVPSRCRSTSICSWPACRFRSSCRRCSAGRFIYTDSAWIRDANPMEAVRQGADEIWIVWTLGNSPEYRAGVFRQYIQMLEMSANGALFEDFERIAEVNQRIANGETSYGRRRRYAFTSSPPTHPCRSIRISISAASTRRP